MEKDLRLSPYAGMRMLLHRGVKGHIFFEQKSMQTVGL